MRVYHSIKFMFIVLIEGGLFDQLSDAIQKFQTLKSSFNY